MSRTHTVVPSPIGPLTVVRDGDALVRVAMSPPGRFVDAELGERSDEGFEDVVAQLGEYFAGERTAFDLPLRPLGSPFELAVWEQLTRIPYGETRSYGDRGRRRSASRAARRRSAPPTAATRWRSSCPATGWSAPTAA